MAASSDAEFLPWWLRLARMAGILLVLVQLSPAFASDPAPQARRGVLELPVLAPQSVRLEGEWGLVRGQFLDPAASPLPESFVHVPMPWNAAGGPHGFGTYALQLQCPAGQKLALSVPAERSAMRVYVNGALAASQGEPGDSAQSARPAIGAREIVTEAFSCPLAIRVHLSNFNHRNGGMVRAIAVGDRAVLAEGARVQLVYNTLMLGAYGVLGLLALIFFAARRKDPIPLYFGFFCLAQAIFADMMGERTLLLAFAPQVPWDTYLRIEYLSFYGNIAAFLVLVHRLFSTEMRTPVVRSLLAVIFLAMLAVAILPARLSSHVVPAGQLLCVVIGLYTTYAVAGAVRRRGFDAAVMLIGLAFLLVVVVIDAALYNAGYWLRTLTPIGLLAFALAPGIVMARRLARALNAEELRALEQRLRGDLLVRTTQAGIFDWDTTRNLRGYSLRLRELLGDPPELREGGGPMFHAFVHPEDREQVVRQFGLALTDRGTASGEVRHPPREYRLASADGSAVWVLAEAISLTGSDGATLRFICSFLDISSRRAMEEGLKASRDQVGEQAMQLRLQNAQLERDTRLREDVERMSRHDLKTPLNSLIGVVRLLREEAQVPPASSELLEIAERAGYRMLEMVNLSLDLFRMEQGSYVFRPQPVDMADVVERVLVDLRSMADGSRVQIEFQHGAKRWPVRAEELLCYTIVANLVKNAIEATPAGATVDIGFLPGTPVRLRIHNPGELAPAVAVGFFDKYFSDGKAGGSGLGTYSARLMARVQEGDLTLEADGGQGIALVLSLQPAQDLPLKSSSAVSAAPGAGGDVVHAVHAPSLAGHVLLVDDDEYNRLVIRRLLPGPPLEVQTAVHGRAALEAIERRWPDVVLIDMEMPVMDGLEATRRIRHYQATHGLSDCTIVMMSSNDDQDSMQRGIDAGADHYLPKPVARDILLGMLASLLPAAPATPVLPGGPDEPPPEAVLVDKDLVDETPEFLATRRELVQAMRQALAADDRIALRTLAHQCTGGLATWGFDWAAGQCRRVEQGSAKAQAAELARTLDILEHHLAQVRIRADHET